MTELPAWVFQGISSFIVAIMGFMLKSARDDLENLKAQLAKTREDYVHKDDLKELKQELAHRFDRVENLILNRKDSA